MSAASRVVTALSALGTVGALSYYAYWAPPLKPLAPGFLPVLLVFFGGLALPYLLTLGLLAWRDGRDGFRFAFGTGVVNAIWALPLGGLLFLLLRGFAMGDRGSLNAAWGAATGALLQISLMISAGAALWRSRRSQLGSAGSPRALRVWILAFLLPVISSGGSFLFLEWQARSFTLRSQQAARNSRAARETLNLLQLCLSNHRGRGYPATLDTCADLSPRTTRSSGYRFEYLPGAPGADGRIGAYLLCAKPLSFRATGFETVVADSTGVTWDGAMEEATVQDPPTCVSVLGAERAIAWCAFSFAAHDPRRAYPGRLADIAGCLSDGRKLARIGPDTLTDENGGRYAYLAGVPGGLGGAARFRIYRLGPTASKARWSDATLGLSLTTLPASGPVVEDLPALAAPGRFALGCRDGRGEDCFTTGLEWQRQARQSEDSHGGSAATPMREKAIEAFTRGCELNEMRSCHWLASELEFGKDVARDLPRSLALHEKACAQGYAPGCRSAAGILERSDAARAVALHVRACDLDDLDGCLVAGRLLAAGEGMVADRDRARALFSRACDDGMAAACSLAASLSPDEAADFKRRACVLGGEEECRSIK